MYGGSGSKNAEQGFLSVCDALQHGGQVRQVMARFPQAPQPYIDLSTGISPFAYPFRAASINRQQLPQQHDEDALRVAAARAYGVADDRHVLAGPGTQMLIHLLPVVTPVADITIMGPTYSGHKQAWLRAGRCVRGVTTQAAFVEAAKGGGGLVIVNPNNPDGRVLPSDTLLCCADLCAQAGGVLIVDEAYADFTTDSVITAQLHPALLVFRSFGKSYGLPGVRLGFLIGQRPEVVALRHLMAEWSVSAEALVIGRQALQDRIWLHKTADRVHQATERLRNVLACAGLETIGESPLFCLVQVPSAYALWSFLCLQGIVARFFPERPHSLRFGLPRDETEWHRLCQALAVWQNGV